MKLNPLQKVSWLLIVLAVFPPARAWSQDSSAKNIDAFEVISIHPTNSHEGLSTLRHVPGGIRARNCSLHALISNAYGMHNFGDHPIWRFPDWGRTELFDIDARLSETESSALTMLPSEKQEEVLKGKLRSLLAERFKLVLHKEAIELSAYELTLSSKTLKFQKNAPPPDLPNGLLRMSHGKIVGEGVPLDRLAAVLGILLKQQVVDKTGLKEAYSFSLQWDTGEAGEEATTYAERAETDELFSPVSANFTSTLIAALRQQLGLSLRTSKVKGEALVIDHVEHPSPN